jgi:hypothetical protein
LAAAPNGQWDFDSTSLAATVGSAMTYLDGPGGATATQTAFGSSATFGIALIQGTNAGVMKFPACTQPMGFGMPTPAGGNGGGSLVNDYTLILDVLYPAASSGSARPIIQTDDGILTPAADFVINASSQIGSAEGPFFGQIQSDTWHRIGFVVQGSLQQIRFYIDGAFVGTRSIPEPYDSRFALSPSGIVGLFNNNNADAATGYVNSVQVRDVVLTPGQMAAMGGPSAAGIPQEIPTVPSFVERWTPSGPSANRITDVGAVINPGDTTIDTSTISLRLDGAVQTPLSIINSGAAIVVLKPEAGPLAAGTTHTLVLSYSDSGAGTKLFTNRFKAALLFEDFEGLVLTNAVEEPNGMTNAWTPTPPRSWVTNHSGMPGYGDPATDGRREWAGWTFAKKSFWLASDNQTRDQFLLGTGVLAIADPDEWDDATHPTFDTNGNALYFNSFLTTPGVSLAGVATNSVFIKFDSSWRPEGFDDWGGTNNQTATVTVSYNNGTPIEILHWDSQEGGPFFHPDSQNEPVFLRLNNPAGATNLVVAFGLTRGGNDWWWAFDNLEINTGPVAPAITLQPQSLVVSTGATVNFSTAATGSEPLSFEWRFNGLPIAGATGASLALTNVQVGSAGAYTVVVANDGGSVTSLVANLTISTAALTEGLVVHLKFDGDYVDASSRGNHAFPSNAPTFEPGFVGQAIHTSSTRTNEPNNFVGLDYPADLQFGSAATGDAVNFSFSFWTKVIAQSDDKPFIANKDWDSGSNPGFVIAPLGGGMKWNFRDNQSARRDSPTVGPQIRDGGWHHVVVTFERTNVARTYIDGVVANAALIAPDAGKAVGSVDTASLGLKMNIGQDGAGDYTDGNAAALEMLMDDLGIWRRLITPQEVDAIYNAALASNDLAKATLYGPLAPPFITFAPTNQMVSEGATAAFNVSALGGNPLLFQWRLGGTNLSGATNRTLSVLASSTNAGNYTVVVSNSSGSSTSSVATLTVLSIPLVTAQPQSRTNNQNMDVSFSIAASGGALQYQWRHEGTNLPGATNATLALASVVQTDAGVYSVEIKNAGGTVLSSDALLTVNPMLPPRLTGQWDFRNGGLGASCGQPLEFFDAAVQADTTFGTTASFSIPDIAGVPADVMRYVPSIPGWGGYKMHHGATPNGGAYVNRYTLICDVYYPTNADGQWRALLQSNTGNSSDAEFFVNSANGVGISGNYQGNVTANSWHRIALAVDLSSPLSPAVAKFIDGVKVGYQSALSGGRDGRFSLNPFALLFADNDGENFETFVSSVQFWDGKLPDSVIAQMGAPTASKLPGCISMRQTGVAVEIYRTGGLGLESAESTLGPWTEVVGAPNPYVVPPSGTAKFFRSKR